MDINNKIAVITGGASGLGRATAQRLVDAGAKVAIFDRNEEQGTIAAKELGSAAIFVNVDVSGEESVVTAIDHTMEALGAIHICCNFAGIGDPGRTLSRSGPLPLDRFLKVLNVNLVGTFNVIRLAAEQIAKNDPMNDDGQRGIIINTSSVAAYEGQIGQAAYSASKGGIVGMTLPIARDLAMVGIRVNTIVPGLIDTPLMAALPEESRKTLGESVLYPQRLGTADEIAHVAQFLIENDYINGESVRMDGGIRMQPR